VNPILAHGLSGPAGGVSSILYLVAAVAAFVFLEARDRRRTAEDPASLNRRVRVAATVCIAALVLGASALWWVPGARNHDKPAKSRSTAAHLAPRR
jgi:NADH:ubiquinone oxidoreductase subunit 6 (subunit J)